MLQRTHTLFDTFHLLLRYELEIAVIDKQLTGDEVTESDATQYNTTPSNP